MDVKHLDMPMVNHDLDSFFTDYSKYLLTLKESSSIDNIKELNITVGIPGSDNNYNMSLSELGYLAFELMNLERLNVLNPANLLIMLYVISEQPTVINEDYIIKVNAKNDIVELEIPNESKKYILEDFKGVYRMFLLTSIQGLDPDRKVIRRDNIPLINDSYILTKHKGGYQLEHI